MLAPGKHYVNSPVSLPVSFKDASGNDYDPTTVVLKTLDPWGTLATYTYGTDSNLTRTSAGHYACAVTPDQAGRWSYRHMCAQRWRRLNQIVL